MFCSFKFLKIGMSTSETSHPISDFKHFFNATKELFQMNCFNFKKGSNQQEFWGLIKCWPLQHFTKLHCKLKFPVSSKSLVSISPSGHLKFVYVFFAPHDDFLFFPLLLLSPPVPSPGEWFSSPVGASPVQPRQEGLVRNQSCVAKLAAGGPPPDPRPQLRGRTARTCMALNTWSALG